MVPGFVATLVRRRREVRRVIGHVEALAPAMTTPELSALVARDGGFLPTSDDKNSPPR
jgi:hypothetical protein